MTQRTPQITLSVAAIDTRGRLVIETLCVTGVAQIGKFLGLLTKIDTPTVSTE